MKKYHLAIVLAAATLLSGCSREENPAPPTPDVTPVPLMISVGVDRLNSRAGVVTGEAFTNEQKINVILVDETPLEPPTPEYPVMSTYVCSITEEVTPVTTWAPVDVTKTPNVMIPRAAVLAHYPAELLNASALSADKRTLEIDIPAEIPYGELGELNFNAVKMKITSLGDFEVWFAKGDEDYMTGYGGTVSALPAEQGKPETTQNKTKITMKHALAMVVVQIKMDDTNPEIGGMIDGLWVKNANSSTGPLQTGRVNLADNAFTPSGARIDYSRPMSKFPIAGKYYFGLLAYPATIAGGGDVEIVCSVGAAQYTYKVPAVTWEAGKVYLYTLKLTPASGVLSDGVRVVDWPAVIENKIEVE